MTCFAHMEEVLPQHPGSPGVQLAAPTRQTEEAPSTQNAREIQLRTLGPNGECHVGLEVAIGLIVWRMSGGSHAAMAV